MPSPALSLAPALQRLDEAKASYLTNGEGSRDAVLEAARALLAEAGESSSDEGSSGEKPSDFLQRVMWAESVLSPILVVAVNLELFQKLRDAGKQGLTTESLFTKSGYHKQQLERVLRHLASSKVIGIKSAGIWLPTPLSDELAESHFQNSILFCHYCTRQVFNGIPEYFKRLTNDEASALPAPIEQHRGPFQIGMETDMHFFEYLGTHPPNGTYFNHFMKAYREGNTMWFAPEMYPVHERLVAGFEPANNETLLVDVGGGRGHELAAFAASHKNSLGKLVLQDQTSVISEIPEGEHPFSLQAHDFFTPQPIKAARAYFLHSILHDWGDEDCGRILENLKSALKPGYSKVLFNEIVLSEEQPSIQATSMDMMMLAHLNPAYERTESAFRTLLEKAGYKVTGVFSAPGAAESVIEAELA